MKKIFVVFMTMCLFAFGAAANVALAAEQKPAATEAKTEAMPAKPETKKKRPHTRFSCTREECVCHGGADCNDLGSTHLCKIDMTCQGTTCRCSRN